MGYQPSRLPHCCFLARSNFVFYFWKEDKKVEQICSDMIMILDQYIETLDSVLWYD